ncbi:hypothetical protein BD779DRAFT_1789443 [Infundibulicybe gibba]|nr:hypothetical protein BD779DRAFT_1789443 [Infundibulicybe gibba]
MVINAVRGGTVLPCPHREFVELWGQAECDAPRMSRSWSWAEASPWRVFGSSRNWVPYAYIDGEKTPGGKFRQTLTYQLASDGFLVLETKSTCPTRCRSPTYAYEDQFPEANQIPSSISCRRSMAISIVPVSSDSSGQNSICWKVGRGRSASILNGVEISIVDKPQTAIKGRAITRALRLVLLGNAWQMLSPPYQTKPSKLIIYMDITTSKRPGGHRLEFGASPHTDRFLVDRAQNRSEFRAHRKPINDCECNHHQILNGIGPTYTREEDLRVSQERQTNRRYPLPRYTSGCELPGKACHECTPSTCEHQGHTWIRTSTDPWETWICEYNTRKCTGTHEFEAVRRSVDPCTRRSLGTSFVCTTHAETTVRVRPFSLATSLRTSIDVANAVARVEGARELGPSRSSQRESASGVTWGGSGSERGSVFEVPATGTRWWREHSKIRWKAGGRDGDGWERRRESWNLPESAAPNFSFVREGDVGLRSELDASGGGVGSSSLVCESAMVQWNENEPSWRNDVEWPLAVQDSGRQLRCSSMDASATLWLAAVCRDDGGVDVGPCEAVGWIVDVAEIMMSAGGGSRQVLANRETYWALVPLDSQQNRHQFQQRTCRVQIATVPPVSPSLVMIDDLGKRKAELLDLISKHKVAISPMRYFPPELLVKIFGHVVAMVHAHLFQDHPPPMMLMEVCTRWRRIVLDTPQLWTRIIADHPMIDSWITRSRELPLHVELNLSSAASYYALETLIPYSHRWQRVDICLIEPNSDILECARTRLDSLKSLKLSFLSITGTVDFFEVAPQLTRVKLIHVYEPVIIKLPWEQLRVCTADNTEVARYVLQHAKNLRKLHLDRYQLSEDDPLIESVMPDLASHSHHLKLSVLIIEWSSGEDLDLFSLTTLPSLQTLQIHFDYDPSDDPASIDARRAQLAPALVGFFERSCAHLDTLEFSGIPFSQGELIKCLAFSPSVVSFSIQFSDRWQEIDEELLDSLRLDANRPRHILPRLRSLTLQRPFGMSIEEPLDNLIASRRHIDQNHDGIALLEDLTLKFPPFQPEELPRFHQFVSGGLNISYEMPVEDWDWLGELSRAGDYASSEEWT